VCVDNIHLLYKFRSLVIVLWSLYSMYFIISSSRRPYSVNKSLGFTFNFNISQRILGSAEVVGLITFLSINVCMLLALITLVLLAVLLCTFSTSQPDLSKNIQSIYQNLSTKNNRVDGLYLFPIVFLVSSLKKWKGILTIALLTIVFHDIILILFTRDFMF